MSASCKRLLTQSVVNSTHATCTPHTHTSISFHSFASNTFTHLSICMLKLRLWYSSNSTYTFLNFTGLILLLLLRLIILLLLLLLMLLPLLLLLLMLLFCIYFWAFDWNRSVVVAFVLFQFQAPLLTLDAPSIHPNTRFQLNWYTLYTVKRPAKFFSSIFNTHTHTEEQTNTRALAHIHSSTATNSYHKTDRMDKPSGKRGK